MAGLTAFKRRRCRTALCLAIAAAAGGWAQDRAKVSNPRGDSMKNVHWLGSAGIKITGSKVVYVDPFKITGGETADLILITHDHFDHLSADDIAKIRGPKTAFVCPASVSAGLGAGVKSVKPGDRITVEGIEIEAVPMYTIGKPFHPKQKQYTGYVFGLDGTRYYHAGDTDLIPEMKSIRADVVFLPVGGTYTMNAQEAADACVSLRPKLAVPIHPLDSPKCLQEFKRLAPCPVEVLQKE